ncbi:MAG: phospholipase D-like domain-containing protein [Candidatus Saccharimonadaceae bacterium]
MRIVRKIKVLSIMIIAVLMAGVSLIQSYNAPVAKAAYAVQNSTTVFNNPYGTLEEKRAIIDTVAAGIDNAVAGSTIRIAVYSFTLSDIADKLIAARDRGVNVHIVTDDHLYGSANAAADTAQMERLKIALGTTVTTGTGSFIKICKDACMGTNIMHAKLFMFSQTGDSKLVTMLSSSNLTNTQINAWNNLYSVVGDQTLFDKMKWYFENMAKEPNTGNWYSSTSSGTNNILTFPRTSYSSTSDDPYYSNLSKVKCTGVASGYGSGGYTTIDVAMFQWTSTRPAVAKKLSDLANAGCKVRVIISKKNYSKDPLVTLTSNSKIKVIDMDANIVDGEPGVYSHNKYMIINGYYDGSSSSKTVFTGSHNLSISAIKYNNELIIRIKDAVVYDKYLVNYNTMWPLGRTVTLAEAKAM